MSGETVGEGYRLPSSSAIEQAAVLKSSPTYQRSGLEYYGSIDIKRLLRVDDGA